MDKDSPRALRDPAEQERRRERWLRDDRFAGLRSYMADIERNGRHAPLIDTGDAANEARVLLVLEAPGTMSDAAKGSGIISVDNNDQTASNCWKARAEVGLFEGVLHWNMVPWYLGVATNKPDPIMLADGAVQLRYLIDLLPNLSTVVLCGEYAKRGWREHVSSLFERNAPAVIETWHPSPSSLNQSGKREDFQRAIARAARYA